MSYLIEKYLGEAKLKLKKVGAGQYEGKIGNIEVDVYKTDNGYWGATAIIGKYGDDDWEEEIFSGTYTKKDMMISVNNFIKRKLK